MGTGKALTGAGSPHSVTATEVAGAVCPGRAGTTAGTPGRAGAVTPGRAGAGTPGRGEASASLNWARSAPGTRDGPS
ncbi:hypothetical protein C4B68_37900 [Streptomyces dengpaensis]|uniref:Uncharacterized protein n=1 Tax=Streptomyces dengpaensis TaxID=2049881 RepID=A0ABM6T0T2_9ACTN|nr:hypothetical protein C4B68_37900 [Streptomyces dengpaensis]